MICFFFNIHPVSEKPYSMAHIDRPESTNAHMSASFSLGMQPNNGAYYTLFAIAHMNTLFRYEM